MPWVREGRGGFGCWRKEAYRDCNISADLAVRVADLEVDNSREEDRSRTAGVSGWEGVGRIAVGRVVTLRIRGGIRSLAGP